MEIVASRRVGSGLENSRFDGLRVHEKG